MDINKIKLKLLDCDQNDLSSEDKSNINGTCNLNQNLLRKTEANTDPLDILKHDPAILEAFVTIDRKQKEDEEPCKKDEADGEVLIEEQEEAGMFSEKAVKTNVDFEKIVSTIASSLLSLTPEQLDLFMKYARVLRSQRELSQRHMECGFCKKNGKLPSWYMSHILRDSSGCVRCPVLRGIRCRRCSATGDQAHTIKYCPENLF